MARPLVTNAAALASRLRPGTPQWRPGADPRAVRIPAPKPATSSPTARTPTARTPTARTPTGRTPRVAVLGGGIAGTAAAVCLAERGVPVTLVEAQPTLGGRVRSWPIDVPGDPEGRASMSRGFHAFFRQYYNLRAILRRVDADLSSLRPVRDYPLVHSDGTRDSFASIPRQPPWNLLGFVATSPSFRLRDLPRVNVPAALGLLDVDFPQTFRDYDGCSAHDVLEELRFPPGMRALALEVFARSFFADPRDFSAGELVGMFHTYFLGSAEGLLFDVTADDFHTVWWGPLQRYLEGLGVEVRCGTSATHLTEVEDGLRVTVSAGAAPGTVAPGNETAASGHETIAADAVVLALDRANLQALLAATPWLGEASWRQRISAQRIAPRFLVQRLWLDTPVRPGTPPFLGTAGFGRLDNVSAVHLFEDGAATWAQHTGGSVVELHAYAVPDEVSDAEALADLRAQLRRVHPELDDATVVHEEVLFERDCPLVGTDPWELRAGVRTPDPRVLLAGDGIRCELPVALMERAATTGVQAANELLSRWGLGGHDLWSVPTATRMPVVVGAARRIFPARARRSA